jgi:lipid II:glycine glycyltransferase (peptidoglycan interpeptide bridge formation enzyme)
MNIISVDPQLDLFVSQADYQVRTSHEIEDPAWDAFLEKNPGGDHVQTSLWAQLKALLGWRAIRIVVTRSENIVGGAQLLIRQLPVVGAIGYVPRGPVFALDDPLLTELIINRLQQIVKDQGIQYLVVQPPRTGEALAGQLPGWGFRPSPIKAAPTATSLIDLTADLDVILARMNKATRKHIRRGLREGIIVREGTDDDVDTFYRLLTATGQRRQFSPYSKEYFLEMWRIFRPPGHIKLFLAEYEGEAVSAHWIILFGNRLISKQSGWSGRHAQRRPNEVLDWEVIKWAKAQDYHYYDFEGIDPVAARAILQDGSLPESFTQTPTSFKLKFGGQVVLLQGAYDYVYNPMLRWAYSEIYLKVANWSLTEKAINRIRSR